MGDAQDILEENFNYMADEYGDDYKISYKIEWKEKLDKDDLKEMKEDIKDFAMDLKNVIDIYEDLESDQWKEVADELGLSKANAKRIPKLLDDLYDELRSAKVTKGYELEVILRINGEYLDEPEEEELTLYVYKINGRWVAPEFFSQALQAIPFPLT